MLALNEGGKDSSLSELIAERPHFAHPQVREEILNFEDVV